MKKTSTTLLPYYPPTGVPFSLGGCAELVDLVMEMFDEYCKLEEEFYLVPNEESSLNLKVSLALLDYWCSLLEHLTGGVIIDFSI